MKVRFSMEAQRDIAEQVEYLKSKTNSGIASFRNIIVRGRSIIAGQPRAGFTDSEIPIRGAMRIIVEGWYFDYDIINDAVWVQRVTSSINTPSLRYDDDFDYEAEDDTTGGNRPGHR